MPIRVEYQPYKFKRRSSRACALEICVTRPREATTRFYCQEITTYTTGGHRFLQLRNKQDDVDEVVVPDHVDWIRVNPNYVTK